MSILIQDLRQHLQVDHSPILIETIRILNGRVKNIAYHNDRCNQTRAALFNVTNMLDLRKVIDANLAPSSLTKCRISYSREVIKVEYEPYQVKTIKSIRCVFSDSISYKYKYQDRQELQALFAKREDSDDVLIIRKGLITDTSYANVALLKDSIWYTPQRPLLKGSMRRYLLKKNKIVEANIKVETLKSYKKLCLFNAIIPFGRIIIPVSFVEVSQNA